MGNPYSQTFSLPVPVLPASGTGTEQLPRLQQLPGAAPVMMPPDQLNYNFSIMQNVQSQPGMQPVQMEPIQNMQNIQNFHNVQSTQSFSPYMAPVMAVILPNYPTFTPGFPSIYPPPIPSVISQAPVTMTGHAPGSTTFCQPQFQSQPCLQTQTSPGLLHFSPRAGSSIGGEEEEAAEPRALFSSSRSSSPLQLNLLQEELPKPSEGQSSTGHNHSESLHEKHDTEVSLVLTVNFYVIHSQQMTNVL